MSGRKKEIKEYKVWKLWIYLPFFEALAQENPKEEDMIFLGIFDSKENVANAIALYLAAHEIYDFSEDTYKMFRYKEVIMNKYTHNIKPTEKQITTFLKEKKKFYANKDAVKFDL